jgi:hypothetical protein
LVLAEECSASLLLADMRVRFTQQLSKQGVRLPNEGTELRPLTALTRCYCLGELRLVDYYGSAFDPKDQDVIQFERTLCARQKMNDFDTSSE